MSKFFIHEELLCRSYILAHLRRRDTFRDQLEVPTSLRSLPSMPAMTYQHLVVILPSKGTFGKIRDRYWWPMMHSDVAENVEGCLSCQHRKTSHLPPIMLTGHRLVTKSFQAVAVDLAEYKSRLEGNRFILFVTNYQMRFFILIPIKSK